MNRAPKGPGLALACLGLLLAGCGPRDQGPPCHPVRGKVLFRGQPAAGVEVFLHPAGLAQDAARAPRPHGKTEAQGEFRLTTHRLDDGERRRGRNVHGFGRTAGRL